jgi:hypothetical protein
VYVESDVVNSAQAGKVQPYSLPLTTNANITAIVHLLITYMAYPRAKGLPNSHRYVTTKPLN